MLTNWKRRFTRQYLTARKAKPPKFWVREATGRLVLKTLTELKQSGEWATRNHLTE